MSNEKTIQTIDFTGLDKATAEKSIKVLNAYLASLHVHYSNIRAYHWHVEGRGFLALHRELESFYTGVFEQIDSVAERIITLGGIPTRKFDDIKALSKIKETEVLTCGDAIVAALLEEYKVLAEQEHEIMKTADENGDIATSDLITGFISSREKTTWMLCAALSYKKA